ncbi:MAG TPA: hypothetical protein VLC09_07450, partial [Polyangiaceae bacterium]|nr:hypothetical protein [Polyangiaceae bacterium]
SAVPQRRSANAPPSSSSAAGLDAHDSSQGLPFNSPMGVLPPATRGEWSMVKFAGVKSGTFGTRQLGARPVLLGLALLGAGLVGVAGCDGGSEDAADSADAGGADGGGAGGTDGTGGRGGRDEVEYADLPGRIRFVNFVSDGEAGVNLDLYWGGTLDDAEFVQTIAYGEVTDYLTPRRPVDSLLADLLDADEARYIVVREGDTTSLPSEFPAMNDESFDADTSLTVGLAVADDNLGVQAFISVSNIYEHNLPTPAAGQSYVYEWSSAFVRITDGDFVFPAADALCDPPRESANGGNIGQAFVFEPPVTGLFLTDANTECATGTTPAEGTLVAGESYLLLGKADTFELSAREAVLLKIGE